MVNNAASWIAKALTNIGNYKLSNAPDILELAVSQLKQAMSMLPEPGAPTYDELRDSRHRAGIEYKTAAEHTQANEDLRRGKW
jgi:hypothetical protein